MSLLWSLGNLKRPSPAINIALLTELKSCGPLRFRLNEQNVKPANMNPLNPSFADDVARSFAQQPIMNLIGAQLSRVEPGVVEITLPYRADLTQQHGYLHAGVITTIADSACGYAAFTLMPAGSNVLSVEFKVNLLRPARGLEFVARAEVIKAGRTLTVVRADVSGINNDHKELVATLQGTMICVHKKE